MLSWKGFIPFNGNMVLKDPSGSTPVLTLQGKLLMTERSGHIFIMVLAKRKKKIFLEIITLWIFAPKSW